LPRPVDERIFLALFVVVVVVVLYVRACVRDVSATRHHSCYNVICFRQIFGHFSCMVVIAYFCVH
jgi:hypothetical protein